jgi:hypothetical protein
MKVRPRHCIVLLTATCPHRLFVTFVWTMRYGFHAVTGSTHPTVSGRRAIMVVICFFVEIFFSMLRLTMEILQIILVLNVGFSCCACLVKTTESFSPIAIAYVSVQRILHRYVDVFNIFESIALRRSYFKPHRIRSTRSFSFSITTHRSMRLIYGPQLMPVTITVTVSLCHSLVWRW